MFEQKRLRGDGSYTTWVEKLGERDQQVNGEDEEFTHGGNGTTTPSACKTARRRRIPSYCEFATHRTKFLRQASGIISRTFMQIVHEQPGYRGQRLTRSHADDEAPFGPRVGQRHDSQA